MKRLVLSSFVSLAFTLGFAVVVARPAYAVCPAPWYITDANDLIQIKGTLYDNAGNATKVSCTFANPFGAYIAATNGFSTPPTRSLQGFPYNCPALDAELGHPIGAAGADEQIIKNGVPTNACAFVGQLDGSGGTQWPNGWYMSSVLKFDPVTGFKSEKGTLIYNLTSGSFIGKFTVIAK
jgi:hypothetical protein